MTTIHTEDLHRLSPTDVAALQTPRAADGGSAYVQRSPSGGLSYVYKYRVGDKQRWLGCGTIDRNNIAGTLAAARAVADEARKLHRAGGDPLQRKRDIAEAQKPGATMTVAQVASAYLAVHAAGWKNRKHAKQWDASLNKHILPRIGRKDVAVVDVDDVKGILAPIWHHRPETARRTRGRLELVLDFAAAHKWRSPDNPARQRLMATALGRKRPPVQHHASLPYEAIPKLASALEARPDAPSQCLLWIVLTAVRSQEARGARWSEIAGDVWVVPPERMKRGIQHKVPLSPAALALLKRLPKPTRPDAYLFPGQRPGECVSDTALRRVLRLLGITAEMGSVHGLRATWRTWAADRGIEEPVAEACLAHAVDNKVIAAYRRNEFMRKRASAMADWSEFVSGDPSYFG
jgi:integrase